MIIMTDRRVGSVNRRTLSTVFRTSHLPKSVQQAAKRTMLELGSTSQAEWLSWNRLEYRCLWYIFQETSQIDCNSLLQPFSLYSSPIYMHLMGAEEFE